jgi:hypothetical protein
VFTSRLQWSWRGMSSFLWAAIAGHACILQLIFDDARTRLDEPLDMDLEFLLATKQKPPLRGSSLVAGATATRPLRRRVSDRALWWALIMQKSLRSGSSSGTASAGSAIGAGAAGAAATAAAAAAGGGGGGRAPLRPGVTALHCATYGGHAHIAVFLLNKLRVAGCWRARPVAVTAKANHRIAGTVAPKWQSTLEWSIKTKVVGVVVPDDAQRQAQNENENGIGGGDDDEGNGEGDDGGGGGGGDIDADSELDRAMRGDAAGDGFTAPRSLVQTLLEQADECGRTVRKFTACDGA